MKKIPHNLAPFVHKLRKYDPAIAAIALFFASACPMSGFAQSYGSEITNATVSLYTWLRGLGAGVTVLGIAGAGFKIVVQHDREGMKNFLMVIGGGLMIMLAPSVVNVIQGTAGAAATITTN